MGGVRARLKVSSCLLAVNASFPCAYPASAKEGAAISRLATAAVATGLIRSTLDTSCAHQAAQSPGCSVAAWCMACWRDCDEGKCWPPSLARGRLQMPLQAALLQMLLQCRLRLQLLRVREPHLLLGLHHHHPRGGAGGRSPDGREGALVAAHKGRHLAAAVKWRGARAELGGPLIRSPTATLVSLPCAQTRRRPQQQDSACSPSSLSQIRVYSHPASLSQCGQQQYSSAHLIPSAPGRRLAAISLGTAAHDRTTFKPGTAWPEALAWRLALTWVGPCCWIAVAGWAP